MIETFISSIFIGSDRSYIYIWVSKQHQTVYVGMTNSKHGTLGRAHSHLRKGGTLRYRFSQRNGIDIDNTSDFKLLSFVLPKKAIYTTVERSYRESIEYLVQQELLIQGGSLTPNFNVVSWVSPSPRRIGNSEVKKLALNIIQNFLKIYPSL